MSEPILTDEDHRIWGLWRMVALSHSKTDRHKHKIDMAKKHVEAMMEVAPGAYIALSGGKDSSAMAVLIAEMGLRPRVMSVKDDLDFSGEEEFVQSLCNMLSLAVDVVRPPFSLQQWIADHGHDMPADEDMHGRSAEFSQAAFYGVIDAYRERAGTPGVYLGLRKGESHGRMMNRATHGTVYQKKQTGEWVCQPLCDWTGLDVFAYLFAHDVPILDVYRCCRCHE